MLPIAYLAGAAVCAVLFPLALYRDWRGSFPKCDRREAAATSIIGLCLAPVWPLGVLAILSTTDFLRYGLFVQRRKEGL